MNRCLLITALLFAGSISGALRADEQMPTPDNGEPAVVEEAAVAEETLASAELVPFERIAPEAVKVGSPINAYRKKDNLFLELTPTQYNSDYIVVISIARGLGSSDLYGGQSIDYGNDMIWRFRKVDDRVQIVRRNFRYRADKGPDSEALRVAFTDSVIFSLPIIARGPQGGDIVDVSGLFLSDSLAMLGGRYISGSFQRDRSTWEKVKGLKDNLELEVAATYASGSGSDDLVIDRRGFVINVHYSISQLKDTGYQPRYADQRVGYFNTAIKDVSKIRADDNFIRYINRWNLQKLEPSAEKSLPKKPIVYWVDKATPFKYRKTVRDAILEWNKAFEKAGFYNAIEVRQQEENDDWEAEDINYNVVRWSATQTGFSIGPSRVNPMTGEILDADVVLSVGFFSSWTRSFQLYTSDQLLQKFTGRTFSLNPEEEQFEGLEDITAHCACGVDKELFYAQQFGLANTFFDVMMVADAEAVAPEAVAEPEEENKPEPQPEAAQNDEAAKQAAEAVAQKAAEEAAVKAIAEKAAEAAAKAEELAKKTAEDAGKADEALREELTRKANEAKEAAEIARRVADETSRKLDEISATVAELKKIEDERKAEAEKKAEEAKVAAAENAKKAEEAKAKAEADKAREENKKRLAEEQEKMIDQGLRQLVSHEVGHTLGLRHNFIQSTLHTLDEINDASKWTEHGFVGSVMEYSPVNIMPKGRQQGDYFSWRLGEYDEWVIEYGYRVFPGKSTDSEVEDLKKIAAKQSLPQYKFATDEDCYGSTINPFVNIWDLGSSPLEYAKVRVQLVDQLLPGLNDRIIKDGESYDKMRTRFNMLNNWKLNGMVFAANYIGGLKVNRDYKGDENGAKPFEVVSAKEQREAMQFLAENCFGVDSFKIPNELFNYLAPNRWRHWGSSVPMRYDYDVHANVASWQNSILSQLISVSTLGRLADAELRVPEGEDVFTSAEMLSMLTDAIYKEVADAENALKDKDCKAPVQIKISTTRRNLQRQYLDLLNNLANAWSVSAGVSDASSLVRVQLRCLSARLDAVLAGGDRVEFKTAAGKDDPYGRAHLEELREFIAKALEATYTL